jgi:hypothetical protein
VLTHPTHDRLIALGLGGMAKAFAEQRALPRAQVTTSCDTKTLLDAYCVPGKSRDQGKIRKNRQRWAWSSVHRTALVGRRHGQ